MIFLLKKESSRKLKKNLKPPKDADIIEEKGLHVSPGLFDLHTNFRDPGFEWKEDIQSGMLAAKGGFTGVYGMPSTFPVTETKSQVEYIQKMSTGNVVDVHPCWKHH